MKNLIGFILVAYFSFNSFSAFACTFADGEKGSTVTATLGDWSGDGHEKVHEFNFCSNLSSKEIKNAYQIGVKSIGFDLINEVATDYEDTFLSNEFMKKLSLTGFDLSQLDADDVQDDGLNLYKEDYFKIWLFFIKVGNSEFLYENINSSNLNIGGYGFFY